MTNKVYNITDMELEPHGLKCTVIRATGRRELLSSRETTIDLADLLDPLVPLSMLH
jgi:hypothetical protein